MISKSSDARTRPATTSSEHQPKNDQRPQRQANWHSKHQQIKEIEFVSLAHPAISASTLDSARTSKCHCRVGPILEEAPLNKPVNRRQLVVNRVARDRSGVGNYVESAFLRRVRVFD